MINKAMERKLLTGEAIDVRSFPATADGKYYVMPENHPDRAALLAGDLDKDLCNGETEEWIWSAGLHHKTNEIHISNDASLYQNPEYKCLWLR